MDLAAARVGFLVGLPLVPVSAERLVDATVQVAAAAGAA